MPNELTQYTVIPKSMVEAMQAARTQAQLSVSVQISTDEEYKFSGAIVEQAKLQQKAVEDAWKKTRQETFAKEYESCRDEKGRIVDALKSVCSKLESAMFNYKRRKDAEARAKQEEENRKAREEQQRLLEEAAKRTQKAEEHAEAGNDRWAAHHSEVAEKLAAEAEAVVPNAVVAEVPKTEGLSISTTWKGRVTDKAAFVKWCLESGSLHFLDVNEAALNREAKNRAGHNPIPGAEWYEDVSSRRITTRR